MSSSGMRVVYKMFYDYCILKARINLWFLIKKILQRLGVGEKSGVEKSLPSCMSLA